MYYAKGDGVDADPEQSHPYTPSEHSYTFLGWALPCGRWWWLARRVGSQSSEVSHIVVSPGSENIYMCLTGKNKLMRKRLFLAGFPGVILNFPTFHRQRFRLLGCNAILVSSDFLEWAIVSSYKIY